MSATLAFLVAALAAAAALLDARTLDAAAPRLRRRRGPAVTLTGFDPAEHPRIGFTYQLLDRELGLQTFSVGEGFPYQEDPSTWATLEMEK